MELATGRRFTEDSRRELADFLNGTHIKKGRGSFPYLLASHVPLLRIIADYALIDRVPIFAGTAAGGVMAVWSSRSSEEAAPKVQARLISDAKPCASRLCSQAGAHCSQRVHGLAASKDWLVAAVSCGFLRAFRLPSEAAVSAIDVGTPLPSQTPALFGDIAFVAGKRVLFAVDLRGCSKVKELPLPFSARPSIALYGESILVQCDEVLRRWYLPLASASTKGLGLSSGKESPWGEPQAALRLPGCQQCNFRLSLHPCPIKSSSVRFHVCLFLADLQSEGG